METGTLCPPSLMTNSNRCFHLQFCDSFCIAAHAHSVSTHRLLEYTTPGTPMCTLGARPGDTPQRQPGSTKGATYHSNVLLQTKQAMAPAYFSFLPVAPFSLVLKKAIGMTPPHPPHPHPRPPPTHAPLPHCLFRPRRASEGWMNENQGALFVVNPPLR